MTIKQVLFSIVISVGLDTTKLSLKVEIGSSNKSERWLTIDTKSKTLINRLPSWLVQYRFLESASYLRVHTVCTYPFN